MTAQTIQRCTGTWLVLWVIPRLSHTTEDEIILGLFTLLENSKFIFVGSQGAVKGSL